MRSILSAYLSTEKIFIILTSTGDYRAHILLYLRTAPRSTPLHYISHFYDLSQSKREPIRLPVCRLIQAAITHNKPSSHGFFMKKKPEIISVIVRSVSYASTSSVCFGKVLPFYMMLQVYLKRASKQKYRVSEMKATQSHGNS